MPKSIRILAVAALLSLVAAPSLKAERMGGNPRPQVVAPSTSVLSAVQFAVLAYLGA